MTEGYIFYKETGGGYQLADSYECQIDIYPEQNIHVGLISLLTDGRLFVRRNYTWEGISEQGLDDCTNLRAVLGHDALCQLCRFGCLDPKRWERQINNHIDIIGDEDKMSLSRSDIREWACSKLDSFVVDFENRREIKKAP